MALAAEVAGMENPGCPGAPRPKPVLCALPELPDELDELMEDPVGPPGDASDEPPLCELLAVLAMVDPKAPGWFTAEAAAFEAPLDPVANKVPSVLPP